MTPKTPVDLWTDEYQAGGIPSSARMAPSGAVVWAVEKLKKAGCRLRTAIDVGCGKGRNSLYLAEQGMEVTALDFTPSAIAALNEAAARHPDGKRIRAHVYDVAEPWPVGRSDIDLIVDAFCFKHITPDIARLSYKQNMLKVLGLRGHYLISFSSIGDGYYGRYRCHKKEDGETDSAVEEIVIDPVNGIESVLYSRARVLDFFAPELELFAEVKHNKPSVMHGHTYERETYALLFRRKPQYFVG
jgi:SAM-dependent methyltransferase